MAIIDIQVNGQPHRLPATATVETLLEQFGLTERRVAIERNGEIVPRSQHACTSLANHDRIEIVHAIGGG